MGTIAMRTSLIILFVATSACYGQFKAPTDIREAGYIPSGYMGDGASGQGVRMKPTTCELEDRKDLPCYHVMYQPGSIGWAGVVWQYPANNWGKEPGRNISGVTKVSFWARGERGQEVVEFKAGGVQTEHRYRDSFEASIGMVTLAKYWKRYEISLRRGTSPVNLASVIGAFAWVATADGNPGGLSFFVRSITYE